MEVMLVVASAVASVAAVVFCFLHSRDKLLLCSALLLGGVALICFGGSAVLAQFDMGWRCAPFNTMMILCIALFAVVMCRCMMLLWKEDTDSLLRGVGICALALVALIVLTWTSIYFIAFSWRDHLAPHNGQMIVCVNEDPGSYAWRYYVHINELVHGAEISHSGNWGPNPPLWS